MDKPKTLLASELVSRLEELIKEHGDLPTYHDGASLVGDSVIADNLVRAYDDEGCIGPDPTHIFIH